MSLMPFRGCCIHCGHDHGNSEFYGDDPIRYQERLKAQATLEKVAVHVLEKQIATLTRQRDLAVEALEKIRLGDAIVAAGYANQALSTIKGSEKL